MLFLLEKSLFVGTKIYIFADNSLYRQFRVGSDANANFTACLTSSTSVKLIPLSAHTHAQKNYADRPAQQPYGCIDVTANFNPRLPELFFVTRLPKGVVTTPP